MANQSQPFPEFYVTALEKMTYIDYYWENYRMGKNCSVDAGKFQHDSLGTIEFIP